LELPPAVASVWDSAGSNHTWGELVFATLHPPASALDPDGLLRNSCSVPVRPLLAKLLPSRSHWSYDSHAPSVVIRSLAGHASVLTLLAMM
jgi:hypothetical protein